MSAHMWSGLFRTEMMGGRVAMYDAPTQDLGVPSSILLLAVDIAPRLLLAKRHASAASMSG